MTAEVIYRRVPGAVDRVLRDRALVVDPAGQGHRLEGLAAIAWMALDEPGAVADVRTRLVEAGLGDDEQGTAMLTDAVELLVGAGLLVTVVAR